ncbi:hypothetical protein BgiBS90_031590 [Biomphalaria glabrata]|nr:hypothetical protein BgiBS90_031590 [Biomphalaria glabrata]
MYEIVVCSYVQLCTVRMCVRVRVCVRGGMVKFINTTDESADVEAVCVAVFVVVAAGGTPGRCWDMVCQHNFLVHNLQPGDCICY